MTHITCNMGRRDLPDMYNLYLLYLRGWIKGFNSSITTILLEVGSYRTVVG